MWFLWLFALFVEDTVYVNSTFPYGKELTLAFPSSSFQFVNNGEQGYYTVYSASLILKDYGNLASLSFRGTRTQDISFELSGVPLKSIQNDYVDISLFPQKVFDRVVTVTHPLSSYDLTLGPSGGMFASPRLGSELWLNLQSKGRKEVYVSRLSKVFAAMDMAYLGDTVNGFERVFGMLEGNSFSVIMTWRNAKTNGPLGSGIRGIRNDAFAGYNFKVLESHKISCLVKGNISMIKYRQNMNYDVHTGFSQTTVLNINPLALSMNHEVLVSTKTNTKLRNTITLSFLKSVEKKGFMLSVNAQAGYDISSGEIFLPYFIGMSRKFEHVSLFFNLSKGVHQPSFFDLYWPKDAFAEGNPYLKSEKVYQRELGIKAKWKGSAVLINGYAKKIKNMIQWINTGERYRPFNVGNRRIDGLEFRISYTNGEINAGYTAALSFFNDILYYQHTGEGFWLETGPVHFYFSYIGRRQKRPNSPKSLPPMELIGGSISEAFKIKNSALRVRLGANNVLNEAIEWLPGYRTGGREYYINLEIK